MQHPAKDMNVFPVGLMLSGRPCLVVGGGKAAARKVRLLLDAEADVTVVAPEIIEEIRAWVEAGKVRLQLRDFQDADARGFFAAFAATSYNKVNRQVLAACRAERVLCGVLDELWPEGDLITPATHRRDKLIVSITTSGRSCRQARLVRDNIARHLEMTGAADLLIIGTSHEQLPLEKREPYHLAGRRLEEVGRLLMQIWGVHEFLVLNTCNRIEFVGVAAQRDDTEELIRRVLHFDALPAESYYLKRGVAAFEHFALLTSGLLSQTPGENHIVAQVKEAFQLAATAGWSVSLMDCWLGATLHVSKHIREAVGPRLKPYETEDLCLQYLRAQGETLAGAQALVLGTGMVGEELVRRCVAAGMLCRWCYHVNEPTLGPDLKHKVQIISLNDLREHLRKVRFIFCAMSGGGHILHQGHAPFFDVERGAVVLDLGLPRNVAPELKTLDDQLRVLDLDDLKHWYNRELADLTGLIDIARQTIHEHRELYDRLVHDIQGVEHTPQPTGP
jgi:glutamyl-tRNA reductase